MSPPTTMPQESPGNPPSRSHVWVAGYYGWSGSAYVWIPGTWQIPPNRFFRRWDPPHWEMHRGMFWRRGQEYRYVPGRWVR
jgi:hypothetical protein